MIEKKFESMKMSGDKDSVIHIALVNKELNEVEREAEQFFKGDTDTYYVEERDIRNFFGVNIKREVFTTGEVKLMAEMVKDYITPIIYLVSERTSPEKLLFYKDWKEVVSIKAGVDEIKIKDKMIIIDGEERHVIEKREVETERVDKLYLSKFVNHHIGALAHLLNAHPIAVKYLISKWKSKTWNKNAKKNYENYSNEMTAYEYRQLSDEEIDEILSNMMSKIYRAYFESYMDGKIRSDLERAIMIWERICREYNVVNIDRQDNLKRNDIKYQAYLERIGELAW